jgi:hypothetical protein
MRRGWHGAQAEPTGASAVVELRRRASFTGRDATASLRLALRPCWDDEPDHGQRLSTPLAIERQALWTIEDATREFPSACTLPTTRSKPSEHAHDDAHEMAALTIDDRDAIFRSARGLAS